MSVPAVITVVVRAPVVPMEEPVVFRVVGVDTLGIRGLTRGSLLYRIRYYRFGRVVCAIFRLRAIFTNSFKDVCRAPGLLRYRNDKGFSDCIFTVFRDVRSRFHVIFPIDDRVRGIGVVPFARLFPKILVAMVNRDLQRANFLRGILNFFRAFLACVARDLSLSAQGVYGASGDSQAARPRSSGSRTCHIRLKDD